MEVERIRPLEFSKMIADAFSEGRKQGLREAVEIVKREAWKPHGNSDKKWLTEKEIIEAIEAALEKVSNGGGE